MAQVSIVKKVSVAVVVALVAATTVSAQEFAPAPAPGPIAGGAFSAQASGVMIGTSLVLSLVAFLRNWFFFEMRSWDWLGFIFYLSVYCCYIDVMMSNICIGLIFWGIILLYELKLYILNKNIVFLWVLCGLNYLLLISFAVVYIFVFFFYQSVQRNFYCGR